jgi:hypothetical protein
MAKPPIHPAACPAKAPLAERPLLGMALASGTRAPWTPCVVRLMHHGLCLNEEVRAHAQVNAS